MEAVTSLLTLRPCNFGIANANPGLHLINTGLAGGISHTSRCSDWLKDGHKTQLVQRRIDSKTFVEQLRKGTHSPSRDVELLRYKTGEGSDVLSPHWE